MVTITFGDRLDESSLAAATDDLATAAVELRQFGGDLRFDLSRLEFAEFGAVARLLLIFEHADRHGAKVRVDLPDPAAGDVATTWRRTSCLRFLGACGFVTAARLAHRPGSRVDITGEPSPPPLSTPPPGDSARRESAGEPDPDQREPFLSFRWMKPEQGEDLRLSEGITAVVRGLSAMSLPQRDADLLARAVVYELMENVTMHGAEPGDEQPPYVLLGAAAGHQHLGMSADPHIAGPSLEHVDSPVIRLVVGDSGSGLVRTLASAGIREDLPPDPTSVDLTPEQSMIVWALDRRAAPPSIDSSGRRGTRGLPRVQRIVRAYGGVVLIGTADAVAGVAFERNAEGNTDRRVVTGAPLRTQPGTLIDLVVVLAGRSGLIVPAYAEPSALDFAWIRVPREPDDGVASAMRRHDSPKRAETSCSR
jgi:hypothetical protein